MVTKNEHGPKPTLLECRLICVSTSFASLADPGQKAGFEQLRVQRGEHVTLRIVTRDAAFISVEASEAPEERQMLRLPKRRLPRSRPCRQSSMPKQTQDFWQGI